VSIFLFKHLTFHKNFTQTITMGAAVAVDIFKAVRLLARVEVLVEGE
jgi:hypothetical protein